MLDKLLPVNDNPADRECSSMARMLIAALASCNHSPDAQTVLVTEVMISLTRHHNLISVCIYCMEYFSLVFLRLPLPFLENLLIFVDVWD